MLYKVRLAPALEPGLLESDNLPRSRPAHLAPVAIFPSSHSKTLIGLHLKLAAKIRDGEAEAAVALSARRLTSHA